MSPPYLIEKSNPNDLAVYLKKGDKSEPDVLIFPVAPKQDKVLIGVVETPYRPPFREE